MLRYFFPLSLSLFACQSKSESCFPEDGIGSGLATAEIDGSELEFTASWLMAGSSLQLNLDGDDSMMTIRLSTSDDGITADSLDSETSYGFTLGDPNSGTATLYPPSESTSATVESSNTGSFTIESFDGQELKGCFSFTAVNTNGTEYDVLTGLVQATESELNQ